MVLHVFLWLCAIALICATLAPLSKQPLGAIRGLAFPRVQALCLSMVLCAAALWFGWGWLVITFAAVAMVQLVYVIKFTPIWKCQSHGASAELIADTSRHVSFLATNVKMSNRAYDRVIDLVKAESCDIVMAIEVDTPWIDALSDALQGDYAHWVRVPMDNGYGLCVMSRLPLDDTEVRELITDRVPSIRTAVTLPMGAQFRLYVVHPEPPVATQDTIGRDGEIGEVGMQARDDALPAIVTGDLNDVAWSTTTRRFQRLSGLLDPRVGRGFYNTFNAFYPIFRWPLDHLFHDPRFRLIRMTRLGKVGSDHFPMLFTLALADDAVPVPSATQVDPEERRDMKDMIAKEADRERTAIGSDWEDDT